MKGFKSFAEKTEIDLLGGVTCVVGPNGSGKSNITDAIRWVLGEQRPKSLRGAKMEDVIFSGTKHRKSLGMAEVKLYFDNSSSIFPIDYEEVVISRRLYRSGEGTYAINNQTVRRKDIRDLIADTGIGKEGYSLVSQGRIEEILSSSYDERRSLFEEACGITKYKQKKVEAQRKIEHTEEHLAKVELLVQSLEERVEPLRISSEKAARHIELSTIVNLAQVKTYAKRYQLLDQKNTQITSEVEALTAELSSAETALQEVVSHQIHAKHTIHTATRQADEVAKSLEKLEHEAQQTQSSIQVLKERKEHLQARVTGFDTELSSFDVALAEQKEAETKHKEKLRTEMDRLNHMERSLHEVKVAHENVQKSHQQHINKQETLREELVHRLNQRERYQHQIDVNRRSLEGIRAKQQSLQETYDVEEKKEREMSLALENLSVSHEASQKEINLNEQIRQDLDQQMSQMQQKAKKIQDELQDISNMQNEQKAEYKINKNMEAEYRGYDRGVKEILSQKKKGTHDIVGNLFTTEKKYETALEIALGRSLQHIVCDTVEDAKQQIKFLRQQKLGRLSFLPMDNVKKNDPPHVVHHPEGFIGYANQLISTDSIYDTVFSYLLGRTAIFQDVDTATKVVKQYVKIVTLDGDVLHPYGAMTGGYHVKKSNSVFARKRRIQELEHSMAALNQTFEKRQQFLEKTLKEIGAMEHQKEGLMAAYETNRMKEMELRHKKESLARAYDDFKQIRQIKDHELADSTHQIAMIQEQSDALQRELLTIQYEVEEREQAQMVMTREINEDAQKLQQTQASMNELAIVHAKLEQAVAGMREEEERLIKDVAQTLERREIAMLGWQKIEDTMVETDQQIVASEKVLEKITRHLQEQRQQLYVSKEEQQRHMQMVESDQEKMDALRQQMEADREKKFLKTNQLIKYQTEIESIEHDLRFHHEMTLEEALTCEGTERTYQEIKELKAELKEIGDVNKESIEEYRVVKERYDFLFKEKQDIEVTKEKLVQIMNDLSRTMEKQFSEQMEGIRDEFTRTFVGLFGGGEANIMLPKDDILGGDIEIFAQPPGKKLQSLTLLSGGEKALTGIALLFAIMSNRPSPFCVLDEIEAALDDANITRFADFLQDYTSKSQFILITHRKGTMEIADNLYGVTMEEYGISKLVSVRLKDYA